VSIGLASPSRAVRAFTVRSVCSKSTFFLFYLVSQPPLREEIAMSNRYLVVRNVSSASIFPEIDRDKDTRIVVATVLPRLKPRTRRSERAEIVLWRKTNKVFRQPSELLRSIVRDSRSLGCTMRAETPNHELAG